jgi:hypothetical protein
LKPRSTFCLESLERGRERVLQREDLGEIYEFEHS